MKKAMISIIIPVYNEANTIEKTLKILNCLVEVPHEVIVVYDHDDDNTIPLIHKLNISLGMAIRLEKNIYGKGVVNAIKTGFKLKKGEGVCVYSADFSDQPEAINLMYNKILEGYDVVSGSRYIPGGQKYGGPWLQTLLSRIGNHFFCKFTSFPLSDITYSFKMYKSKVLDAIDIEYDAGWVISMEICLKAYLKGFKLTEIPAVWIARQAGESKFFLKKWLPSYLHWFLYGIYFINKNKFMRKGS